VEAAHAVVRAAPGVEVVVVDNASRDSIAEDLAREVPTARLLVEDANRGYGAACNRGARETERPLLLFLNSDALVEPRAVNRFQHVSNRMIGRRECRPHVITLASLRMLRTVDHGKV